VDTNDWPNLIITVLHPFFPTKTLFLQPGKPRPPPPTLEKDSDSEGPRFEVEPQEEAPEEVVEEVVSNATFGKRIFGSVFMVKENWG
jgi:hypothetical protein